MNSLTIAVNILRRISKEKLAFLTQVLAPVLIGLLMFSVLSAQPSKKKDTIGITNIDKGIYGSMLLDSLKSQDKYNIVFLDKDTLQKRVTGKKITAGILIPENFSEVMKDNNNPKIILYNLKKSFVSEDLKLNLNTRISNISLSINAGEAIALSEPAKAEKAKEILKEMDKKLINTSTEAVSDEKDVTMKATVFGFFLMFILQFAVLGVGLILEDKKGKTFMRSYCAPVKNYEIVLGNLIANFAMGVFMIGVFLMMARFIYNIHTSLNIFILLIACLTTSIGYAIGVSGFIRDNEKFIATSGPLSGIMCILGGCFIPFEMLPQPMQKIAGILPTRWAMDGIYKVLNGGTLKDIFMNLSILLLFGLGLFIFGVNTLRSGEGDF